MITLDARQLAKGWLAIAAATGKDKDRPALCKTIHIDQYDTGVRLVATDTYVLLTCWIPSDEDEYAPEPDLYDTPMISATAIDRWGRAQSLFTHLRQITSDDEMKSLDVDVHLNVEWQPEDDVTPRIDGLEALAVRFQVPDRESLQLEVYDGRYPAWQGILARQHRGRTEHLAIAPWIAGQLAKAGKIFNDTIPVKLWFGGKDKPIMVEFGDQPSIRGLVMPLAWNFDEDRPYEHDPGEPAPGEGVGE